MLELLRAKGVRPYLMVVFLNAFVDLGHKIVIQNTIFKVYDGSEQIVLAAFVNAMILLPYIFFFVPAANISTRFSKNTVMRLASASTIFLTLGITFCYYQGWFELAFFFTFLLAVESAFFGPAKIGYIKFMAGEEKLSQGNGFAASMAILAILLGTFFYSVLFEGRFDRLGAADESAILQAIAPLGWVLVSNAVLQTWLAWRLPTLEQGDGKTPAQILGSFSPKALTRVLKPAVQKLPVRYSILGLTVFWSVSQVMIAAFPAYAKETIGITNTVFIQGTVASSGLGIMFGALFAGLVSKRNIELGLVPLATIGITIGLVLIPTVSSLPLLVVAFLLVGFCGGMAIVPLNATIQYHSEAHELGNTLAANGLMHNIGMVTFLLLTVFFAVNEMNAAVLLSMLGVVTFVASVLAVINLPEALLRVIVLVLMRSRYRVRVSGLEHIPATGGVLLLGNHISWIDWGLIQIVTPRQIRFVMEREMYDRWYLTWFFKLYDVVPIEPNASAAASLKQVGQLLQAGEVVCLFPEGGHTRSGEMNRFRAGFEIACRQVTNPMVIVPFYLKGLWGSRLSRSSHRGKELSGGIFRRNVTVSFGHVMPQDSEAAAVQAEVARLLSITE